MNTYDRIVDILSYRREIGIQKYQVPVDEGKPPTGCWKLEAVEELADAIVYITQATRHIETDRDRLLQENMQLQKTIKELRIFKDKYEGLCQ